MAKHKNRHEPTAFDKKEGEAEYIGNLWGWKFTFWGALFIILLILFMWYRFHSLGVSPLDENGHVIYRDSI